MLNVFYVKDIFIVPIDILARLCKILNIIIIYVPTYDRYLLFKTLIYLPNILKDMISSDKTKD